jgi:ElaB/YqjD/DUF883 family membrane-anchored ribosome-binding protein
MTTASKTGAEPDAADIAAILRDIASLKADFAALAEDVKKAAVSPARRIIGQIEDEASRLGENLAVQRDRAREALSQQVEEQPFTSLLVAFAIGLIGGRLLLR